MPVGTSHRGTMVKVLLNFVTAGSAVRSKNLVGLRFVDHYGQPTEQYPLNPNGSVKGSPLLPQQMAAQQSWYLTLSAF